VTKNVSLYVIQAVKMDFAFSQIFALVHQDSLAKDVRSLDVQVKLSVNNQPKMLFDSLNHE